MDRVCRVTYRTESGTVGSFLLIAGSPEEAERRVRDRDSVMKSAPMVKAVALPPLR